jgi:all-trans-retinol dehydrogenase (NAD+)
MITCLTLIAACTAFRLARPWLLGLAQDRLPLSGVHAETALWYLTWSFALGVVVEANAVLNRWAENKWLWKNDTSAWDWKHEVAVVTGGSQGIGACVVKSLVSHGIRCAVLDVAPLSEDFSRGDTLPPSACTVRLADVLARRTQTRPLLPMRHHRRQRHPQRRPSSSF